MGHRIEYGGASYVAQPGETLLAALLRQGAEVGHSCRKGSCGCCQLRLASGPVRLLRDADPALVGAGHVLCCVAEATGDVVLEAPDPAHRPLEVELVARRLLAPGIVALDLAPLRTLAWRPGQHVHLVRGDGLARPYSIACSAAADWYFSVHVRRVPGGAMSGWLHDALQPGDRLHMRGPAGTCCYQPAMRTRPLLMLATGTGAGALLAVARAALADGHAGPIEFRHGVREAADLYLDAELRALAAAHPGFSYHPVASRGPLPPGVQGGRIVDAAFFARERQGHELFLCGLPAMVEDARVQAVRAGVQRERVHADPFEFAHRPPRDAEKFAALAPDPELWAALDHGPRLTRILQDFYARVYVDPQLAPFFHNVTRERAIQKQYEFLADVISGRRAYFGLNPFNAHHWMVISDALFDYREALFEQVLRAHGLAEPMVRRWLAMHETFRSEIVKNAPRGMVVDGVEQPLHSHSEEQLDIDTVCDGCAREILAGTPCRYQHRLGTLHCPACAGMLAA